MEDKNSINKKTNLNELFESFVKQAKQMGLPLSVGIVNLGKEEKLSGEFKISTGDIKMLQNKVSDFGKDDIAIPLLDEEVKTKKIKPR